MQRRALASVCAVLFLTFLDNTVISVALADLQTTLHPGIQGLQWIVDGYMLAFAALMLTGGTLGDILGRKRVMLAGVAVFCAGSVVSALASDAGTLIAGRVVMGVGAAASEPGTLSVLRQIFPERTARARAVGAWVAVSAAALGLGPIVAGLIIQASSWHEVFWFNLGFGALAFVAAAATVPESADREGRRFDLPGLLLGAGAVTAATFAIIEGEVVGYRTWWVDALLGVAVLAVAAFAIAERRAPDPVLRLSLFRDRTFATANVGAFAASWGVFAVFFFTAFYLQLIAAFSPARIALQFAAMTAAMWVAAAIASVWTARSGPRASLVVGGVLGGGGLLLVGAFLNPDVTVGRLAWALAIAGFGLGMAFVATTAAVLSAVGPERSGMAGSTVNTSRELGGVFGVAILGSILSGRITGQLAHRLSALGIPPDFRAIVIEGVTHGAVPKSSGGVSSTAAGGAARGHAALVNQVIHAAEQAFGSGLHVVLPLVAGLLFGAAALALVAMRAPARRPSAEEQRSTASRARWRRFEREAAGH